MGLLSDPSLAPRNKLGRYLAQHVGKLSFLLYAAGLVWFGCLASSEFHHNTYLSENALSPGLVYPEMNHDSVRLAQTLTEELKREREARLATTPHAWIVAKMMQIGLETHVHNFTLNMAGKEYHGKNVYGILRAPRIGSTEGVVYAAPYRAPASVHDEIAASVPVLLAFADFARRKNYWAKDLIFLVTEQEQLGMHAWLEAYFEGGIQDSAVLRCGNLPARAGALQAAINLEIQDLDLDYIDVKIEGLNGQLPNLDLFNLVQRITSREGISSGYKHTPQKKRRSSQKNWDTNLKNMLAMLMTQATGVPNGNHGLFHRYRVEAVTLEAVKRTTHSADKNGANGRTLSLLKSIEGISRSLNNLLERFHQSFFFYILVTNDRFVSIGDFMPCLVLLISPMFLKAFLLWLTANGEKTEAEQEEEGDKSVSGAGVRKVLVLKRSPGSERPYGWVLLYLLGVFALSSLALVLPMNADLRAHFGNSGVSTATGVAGIVAIVSALSFVVPLLLRTPDGALELLHIAVLIFMAISLLVVGLLNFALGFFLSALISPLVILVDPTAGEGSKLQSLKRSIASTYLVLLNPLVTVYLLVLALAIFQFPELGFVANVHKALTATMDAITFALMDYEIYGNWLYRAITSVFLPLWTMCWTLTIAKRAKTVESPATSAKKTN